MNQKLKNIKVLKKIYDWIRIYSLDKACIEQKLKFMFYDLICLVPNIKDQYSHGELDTLYLQDKVRMLHAFQMSLIKDYAKENNANFIVDIGDSSGLHLEYFENLYGTLWQSLSINTDPKAIERIRKRGYGATQIDAVKFAEGYGYGYIANTPDMIWMFETLEHIEDPIRLLKALKRYKNPKRIIITVPYVSNSRIGMYHLRKPHDFFTRLTPETTHIFELSPEDWKLLFRYCGWEIEKEQIYYQYPRKRLITKWLWKWYWKKYDFEGFYGVVLK